MNQKGSVAIALLVGLVIVLGGALGYTVYMDQAATSDAIVPVQDDSDIFKTPPTQKTQPVPKKPDASTNTTAPNPSNGLEASPVTGSAPLQVIFTVPSIGKVGAYYIETGDGGRDAMDGVGRTDGRIGGSHWYTKGGTYDARVIFLDGSCKGESCTEPPPLTLGTARITVGAAAEGYDEQWGEPSPEPMKQIVASSATYYAEIGVPMKYASHVQFQVTSGIFQPGADFVYKGPVSVGYATWYRYDSGDAGCMSRKYYKQSGSNVIVIWLSICESDGVAWPNDSVIEKILATLTVG